MKKGLMCILVFLIFYVNSGIAFAVVQKGKVTIVTEIPRGTVIPVSFVTSANSDRLYSGDVIPLVVTEDVSVDNVVVFQKDARGTVEVEKVIRSGSHGRAGLIDIRSAKVKDVFGNIHNVQLNILVKGESRRPSAIALSVLGVLLILVPFGIWREGDPAYISASQIYDAVTTK